MKKLLIIALILSMLVTGIVVAQGLFRYEVPYHIGQTVQITPGLKLYSDPGTTQEVTFIDFSDLDVGQTSTPIVLYLKNIGNQDFSNIHISNNFSQIVVNVQNDFPLATGVAEELLLSVTKNEFGTFDGTLIFEGVY